MTFDRKGFCRVAFCYRFGKHPPFLADKLGKLAFKLTVSVVLFWVNSLCLHRISLAVRPAGRAFPCLMRVTSNRTTSPPVPLLTPFRICLPPTHLLGREMWLRGDRSRCRQSWLGPCPSTPPPLQRRRRFPGAVPVFQDLEVSSSRGFPEMPRQSGRSDTSRDTSQKTDELPARH